MDTLDAIRARRSVKHYDPEQTFSDDEVREFIELATDAPTSFNIQNWRFVVPRDPELRKEIRSAAWDQAQVTDASMLVILCADLNAWERDIGRMWENAPTEVQDILLPKIDEFYRYRDKPQLQRDEAMRSCGLAAQTLMLAAKAKGYDSCPMIGFDPVAVGELIRLPEDHVVGMMVAIGKKKKDAQPRGGQRPVDEVLVVDRFG
jgi:nitroreductase